MRLERSQAKKDNSKWRKNRRNCSSFPLFPFHAFIHPLFSYVSEVLAQDEEIESKADFSNGPKNPERIIIIAEVSYTIKR